MYVSPLLANVVSRLVWSVLMCTSLRSAGYVPGGDTLFGGLVVSVSGFTTRARETIFAAVQALGGRWQNALTTRCTHLIVRPTRGSKTVRVAAEALVDCAAQLTDELDVRASQEKKVTAALKAIENGSQLKIVGTLWLNDSIRLGRFLDEAPYWPLDGPTPSSTPASSQQPNDGSQHSAQEEPSSQPTKRATRAKATTTTHSSQDQQRQAEEDQQDAESKRQVEEERQRQEDAKRQAEEERQRQAAESKRQAEQEQQRQAAESKRQAEEERQHQEDAKRQAEQEQQAERSVSSERGGASCTSTSPRARVPAGAPNQGFVFVSPSQLLSSIKALVSEAQYTKPEISWIKHLLVSHGSQVVDTVHDATHVFLKKGVDRVRSLPACL